MIKRKEMMVTIGISVLLIFGGTIGFSICYHMFFQPEKVFEAEVSENNDWKIQQQAYEAKVLHPFYAWKDEGVISEVVGFDLFYEFYHRDGERYAFLQKLLQIYDIDCEEIYGEKTKLYTFDRDSKEYREYGLTGVYQIEMGEDGEELVLVLGESEEVVSCQYYGQKSEGGETSQIPITEADLPKELKRTFDQLDYIYDYDRYFQLTVDMGEKVGSDDTPAGRMSVYTAYADWELYTDDTMAAYVGIIGEYNFIFYYDRINNRICGFNFGMNPKS